MKFLKLPQLYILKGKKPVPAESIEQWGAFFESDKRIVAQESIGEAWISTVFLGLDHSFSGEDESPVLFESMVFGGTLDGDTARYCTWSEAEQGHREMVDRVKRLQFKVINGG